MNILRMKNSVQTYAWGSMDFIQNLTGDKSLMGKPVAELWMGAHPSLPSLIKNGREYIPLDKLIAGDPSLFLGEQTAREFQGKLPFLIKVLAARQPLSIQAHPNKAQAVAGFRRETELGIPLDAPNRSYKDANHKPELVVPLTRFTALAGFIYWKCTAMLFEKYFPTGVLKQLPSFLQKPDRKTFQPLFEELLDLDNKQLKEILAYFYKLRHKISILSNPLEFGAFLSIMTLISSSPDDTGCLAPMYLNSYDLSPCSSLYIPAGTLHAYLGGAAIEIMATSDNVLRGGLTHKYIDKKELFHILDWNAYRSPTQKHLHLSPTETLIQCPAREFRLSVIKHKRMNATSLDNHSSAEIIFCYEGKFHVQNCSQILDFTPGQSLFVPAGVNGYSLTGTGVVYRAGVNL